MSRWINLPGKIWADPESGSLILPGILSFAKQAVTSSAALKRLVAQVFNLGSGSSWDVGGLSHFHS
jgi:hypothetical protein